MVQQKQKPKPRVKRETTYKGAAAKPVSGIIPKTVTKTNLLKL
jgi:hypothetical protein